MYLTSMLRILPTTTKSIRILIRKLLKELPERGLDKKKFKNTVKNLKYSNVINYYVNQNIKKIAIIL